MCLPYSCITELDNLGDEDLERIRQERVQEMRRRQVKSKEWLAKGHGEYTEVATEQEFFKSMKASILGLQTPGL